VNLITFGFTVLTFVYTQWKNTRNNKSIENLEFQYKNVIDEQNKDITLSQSKIQELEGKRKEIEGVLTDVNNKLNEENINKEELIRDLKDNLEVLILVKHVEGQKGQQPKHLSILLKKRGFRSVAYGLWMLPPSLSPNIKDVEKLNQWLTSKILSKLPQGYRHKISIMIVDLNKVLVKGEGETRMKSIFEKINITDLVKLTKLNEYLKKKKNISLIDIIQIPKLERLINKPSYGFGDHSKIEKDGEKILLEIGKQYGWQDIKTKNLADIDKTILIDLLKKYQIKNFEQISNDIIENSKFWRQF